MKKRRIKKVFIALLFILGLVVSAAIFSWLFSKKRAIAEIISVVADGVFAENLADRRTYLNDLKSVNRYEEETYYYVRKRSLVLSTKRWTTVVQVVDGEVHKASTIEHSAPVSVTEHSPSSELDEIISNLRTSEEILSAGDYLPPTASGVVDICRGYLRKNPLRNRFSLTIEDGYIKRCSYTPMFVTDVVVSIGMSEFGLGFYSPEFE